MGKRDLFGYFDHASADRLHGWVADRAAMDAAVEIEAVQDGAVIARLHADDMREDLRGHGIGTGRYGFRLDRAGFGAELPDLDSVALYLAGTDLLLQRGEGGRIAPETVPRAVPADPAAWLASLADGLDVVVEIAHPHALIGDTLTALPLVAALHRLFARPIHLAGAVSRPVRALLPPDMARFDPPGPRSLRLTLGVQPARLAAAARGLHAAQGFFLLAGLPPPPMPLALEMVAAPCGLPPGVVLAPFTASERGLPGNHARMWYPARWAAVAAHLRETRGWEVFYVLGAAADDFTGFDFPGAVPVIDRPLPQVLDLMRAARLVVTVESGPGHLAHLGGVARHVLLYGDAHQPRLVATAIGQVVRGKVADLPPAAVIAGIEAVLAR